MLPFGGQGTNQAIEDGGAIGFLLVNVDNDTQLPQRLQLFDQLRRRRASRIQILSSVRASRESVVEEKIKPFMEDGVIFPNSFPARVSHDAGFDVYARSQEMLQLLFNSGDGEMFLDHQTTSSIKA
ncbi:unnamed protein product [Penicillium pancosmium]